MATTTIQPASLLSDAVGTLLVRLLGTGLVFVTTTVAARVLGPHEFGIYNAGSSLAILLATLVPMGTDRVLVRNLSTVVSPTAAGHDTALSHICTAIMCLLLLCAGVLQYLLRDRLLLSASWLHACMLAAVTFIPVALTNLRQWIAIPLIGTRYAVLPEQTILPLAFTGTVGLAALLDVPQTAWSATWTYALLALLVWGLSLLTEPIRTAYSAALSVSPQRADIQDYLRSALPFVGMSVGVMLIQRSVPLLIAMTCGFAETAQFAVAQQFAGLSTIPLGVAALCILPQCTRQYRQQQLSEAAHSVRQAATLTFLLSLLTTLLTWLASPLLVDIFGQSYARVQEILPTLLLVSVVETVSGPSVAVMQAMRLEHALARIVLGFIPVQLGLIYVTSLAGGLEGGACGLLLSRLLWIVAVVWNIYVSRGVLSLPYLNPRTAGLQQVLGRLGLLRL